MKPPKGKPPKRRKREKLYVVPNNRPVWEEFCSFFEARKAIHPAGTEETLFIADSRGLVAGVCVYACRGPFVFLENLATNPDRTPRLRHRAVSLLVALSKSYAATHSKYPLVIVRSRGLAKMLTRLGYEAQRAVVMTTKPVLEVP